MFVGSYFRRNSIEDTGNLSAFSLGTNVIIMPS